MNSAVRTSAYRTIDLVTIAVLGVAFGVIFWGWDKVYEPVSAAFEIVHPTTKGLLGGVWLIAAVVGALVVRRPGAALATELVAASMELVLPGGNQWGVSAMASGLIQGLGVELVFALFLYRRFGLVVAALAGVAAAVAESLYEWHAYFPDWHTGDKWGYLAFFAVSGAVVAGGLGTLLVKALARAGVLDAFDAGREAVVPV